MKTIHYCIVCGMPKNTSKYCSRNCLTIHRIAGRNNNLRVIKSMAKMVKFGDSELPFTYACRKAGISPSAVQKRMADYGVTRQEAIDFYYKRMLVASRNL